MFQDSLFAGQRVISVHVSGCRLQPAILFVLSHAAVSRDQIFG